MSAKPRVLVLRAAGTNCDVETARAFALAGGEPELVHVNRLLSGEKRLGDYSLLAIPGGFTYGDDIAAGRVLAAELRTLLREEVKALLERGGLVIGICNGFQVLVNTGLLPGINGVQATLTHNDSRRFEARWVHLEVEEPSRCLWTQSLSGRRIELPVAHGEGKFVTTSFEDLEAVEREQIVAARYIQPGAPEPEYPFNPNGSWNHIAGICDPTGRIFGLMPHPERFVESIQHPRRSRGEGGEPWGLSVFVDGVKVAQKSR